MMIKNKITGLKCWLGILFVIFLSGTTRGIEFMEMKKDSVIKYRGYILRQSILGKDQKSVSYHDYYFLPVDSGSAGMFIKVKEGDVSTEFLDSLLIKESDLLWKSGEVNVIARLKDGKWDDPDFRSNVNLAMDPRRKGVYVVLREVTPVSKTADQEYTGALIKTQQVNKAGRKLKTFDFFFVVNGKDYFVKSSNNTVERNQLDSLVKNDSKGNSKSGLVTIRGEIKKGLWDTDDPKQQSRIGDYIFIYEIKK